MRSVPTCNLLSFSISNTSLCQQHLKILVLGCLSNIRHHKIYWQFPSSKISPQGTVKIGQPSKTTEWTRLREHCSSLAFIFLYEYLFHTNSTTGWHSDPNITATNHVSTVVLLYSCTQIRHLSSVLKYMDHTLKIELEHIFHAPMAFIETQEKLVSKAIHFCKP